MSAIPLPKQRILIVDREVLSVGPLSDKLTEAGFAVDSLPDVDGASRAISTNAPDLVILDWNLPGVVTFEVINGVRNAAALGTVRLIILSARATEADIVAGLELGADDYITKPASTREIVARVRAVLRSRIDEPQLDVLKCGDLMVDPVSERVTVAGKTLNLRSLEYRLLEFLMRNRERSLTRGHLLKHVWGTEKYIDERTVDVNVQRLRNRLASAGYGALIQTIRGIGYRLSEK